MFRKQIESVTNWLFRRAVKFGNAGWGANGAKTGEGEVREGKGDLMIVKSRTSDSNGWKVSIVFDSSCGKIIRC